MISIVLFVSFTIGLTLSAGDFLSILMDYSEYKDKKFYKQQLLRSILFIFISINFMICTIVISDKNTTYLNTGSSIITNAKVDFYNEQIEYYDNKSMSTIKRDITAIIDKSNNSEKVKYIVKISKKYAKNDLISNFYLNREKIDVIVEIVKDQY